MKVSDFQVIELDRDGNKVILKNADLPDALADPKSGAKDQPKKISSITDNDMNELALVAAKKKAEHQIDVTTWNKEERKDLHLEIRKQFSDLVSNTVEKDGKKYITAVKKSDRYAVRERWPADRGRYCNFTLCKCNIDTNSALANLARYLRINVKYLNFAGMKDKRAITSQRVSASYITAERIIAAGRVLIPNVRLGDYVYDNVGIRPGLHTGNHFKIAISAFRRDQHEARKQGSGRDWPMEWALMMPSWGYVWNRVVSRRIKEWGTEVVVGDLVEREGQCHS
ncbi:unnamed protein product [Cyprideis torosa]|uniref:Uncharacterized protein n=1 Tax=Cyprideis torosa TaxID=163714 RepID=A0A7R8W898_9CRUS|nr:unnamed protein product [Cyprideis torosa]CAG0888372.1 unnamed protein product [Cyprideis torosa]